MLANSPTRSIRSGAIGKEVLLRNESLLQILEFIASELPKWRDQDERPPESSENRLTAQLCSHLNGAARRSGDWDFLQFRTEIPEKGGGSRAIDLAPQPIETPVLVEGLRYCKYDYLFPIECKRLPTPRGAGRDEQEYVINRYNETGGIQRFKLGAHGATHRLAAMIAYIQNEAMETWRTRISDWIQALARSDAAGWSPSECPELLIIDSEQNLAHLRSFHPRKKGLPDIELRHLWVVMD